MASHRHSGAATSVTAYLLSFVANSHMNDSRLLDAQLMRSVESGSLLAVGKNNPIIKAMLALLEGDGLTQRDL